jgi:hypothetical protein
MSLSPSTPAIPTPSDSPIAPTPTPPPIPTWRTIIVTPTRRLTPEELIAQTFQHLAEEPLRSGRQLCRPHPPITLYEQESADKRYRAFIYKYETLIFVACIFDTQSSTFQTAGRGLGVAFEWSPTDDYLLVNQSGPGLETYIINVTTGANVQLPAVAVWEPRPYSLNPMGITPDGAWYPKENNTGMAWSPDGASIAITTAGRLYILDTATLWQKGGRQAIQKEINVSLMGRPRWSDDGQFILSAEVVTNPNRGISPQSMMDGFQSVRIDVRTGEIQKLDRLPP